MSDPSIDTIPHQETDGTGKVRWSFPSTWAPADCLAFEGLMADVGEEEERIGVLDEAAFAPSAILASKRAELAEVRAQRVARERDADEDAVFAAASKAHGGDHRVFRLRTCEGSIILRPETLAELDRVGVRITAEGIKPAEVVAISRDSLAATVVHPPRARLDAILALYPGLWTALYDARRALTSGLVEDAEKKA